MAREVDEELLTTLQRFRHAGGGAPALVVTTAATAALVAAGRGLSNQLSLLLMAIACGAYLLLITDPVRSRLTLRLVAVAVACQTLVAIAVPPRATEDLWWYAIYGRILAVYRASPYTHVGADWPHDPLLHMVGHAWRHTPSVYGPVFTAMSAVVSPILGTAHLPTRLFYQGLAAVALAAVCTIVWRRTRSAEAVAFIALNPMTCVYLVNGGRNDMLVGLALLGAVVLVEQGRTSQAGVVGGLGALVKLTGLVGVVGLVAALLVQRKPHGARRVAVAGLVTVAGAYAIAGVRAMFTPMDTAGAMYSHEAPWRLLGQVGVVLPSTEIALAVLAVVVAFTLWRSARCGPEVAVTATTTALTLGATYSLPGYAGWALPTAALRHRSRIGRLVAYEGVAFVALYEVVRHPLHSQFGVELTRVADVVGPLLVLGLLARLLWCVWSESRATRPLMSEVVS
jgi:hypothetical protein